MKFSKRILPNILFGLAVIIGIIMFIMYFVRVGKKNEFYKDSPNPAYQKVCPKNITAGDALGLLGLFREDDINFSADFSGGLQKNYSYNIPENTLIGNPIRIYNGAGCGCGTDCSGPGLTGCPCSN
jgi:hypothetical protein